ncbi:DUF6503 family protein [Winogradskyella sp. A3E31]|uniref:DUF6503 family protein n=1 Tax=Winogradskyella sp. A3E31 TaxID=3349637 RepID=UPI00398B531A
MKNISIFLLAVLFMACKSETDTPELIGDVIINKAIDASGVDVLKNAKVSFDFRGTQYLANRNNGQFVLARVFLSDTNDSIFDVLSNDGFERFVNDEKVQLPDTLIAKYTPSVNSVHYFSVLPYGLNNKAVNKFLIGKEIIKNTNYHKVKVTFDEEGGGEDFEDVFIYWINSETYNIEYLAYSYAESDGQGLRFREAYNARNIEGVKIVDYNNYKPNDESVELKSLGKLFESGQLQLLSKIELENVEIDLIDNL